MAFPCIVCGVSFDKSNHLQRHILTRKHQINNEFHSILRGKTSGDQKLQFVLPAEVTCTPAETEQSQDPPPIDHGDVLFSDGKKNNELESDDIENHKEHVNETCFPPPDNDSEWFPFPDKLSLLLYGLLHSPTHHISLEVAKYVWFILKEMGVPDIPPLAKIRSMKFGQLDVENLISKGEDDSGLPIYIIKPSEIAKLNLSNPTI